MKDYKLDKFIEFVIDLVNEDSNFFERQVDSKYYFIHGGCYELYKIVNHYFPQVRCMISDNLEHCVIEYQGKIYDAIGIRDDIYNFKIATDEDIDYMNRSFGLGLSNLKSCNIIKNIEKCNVKNILY